MLIKKILLLVIIACITNAAYTQQQVFDKNKFLLEPFEYNEVKLQSSL